MRLRVTRGLLSLSGGKNMNTKLSLILAGIMIIWPYGASSMAQPYLDCSDASIIACGETQTNATAPGGPGAGNVSVWCNYNDYSYADAREFVYEFTLEEKSHVSIVMTYTHIPNVNDLDMSLRSICDEGECLAFSIFTTGTEEMEIELPAGTYYVSVDGFKGRQDGSPHTITINCDSGSFQAVNWGDTKALFR